MVDLTCPTCEGTQRYPPGDEDGFGCWDCEDGRRPPTLEEWDLVTKPSPGYREMVIGVPEEEMDQNFLDAVTDFVHDFLMARAVRGRKQGMDDCEREEVQFDDTTAQGCYGCNAVISAQGIPEEVDIQVSEEQ